VDIYLSAFFFFNDHYLTIILIKEFEKKYHYEKLLGVFLTACAIGLKLMLSLSPNPKKEAAQGKIQCLLKTNLMSYILLIYYESID